MKQLQTFVAALLALAIAGCGGSGGGGSDNGNNPPIISSTPRIEAVVRIERTNLEDASMYTDEELRNPQTVDPTDLIDETVFGPQDLLNFQAGESYYFQLVSYTSSGERLILPAAFSSQDIDQTYGVVGDSGLFLASNEASPSSIFVYAEYNGQRYSAAYEVQERQARVLGRVLIEGTNRPLPGARVEFYDVNGALVGQANAAYDGSYRASVPLSAAFVTIGSTSLSNDFFRSFVVDGFRYDAGAATCRSPLPIIEIGTQTTETIFVTARVAGQTTPVATGCVQ